MCHKRAPPNILQSNNQSLKETGTGRNTGVPGPDQSGVVWYHNVFFSFAIVEACQHNYFDLVQYLSQYDLNLNVADFQHFFFMDILNLDINHQISVCQILEPAQHPRSHYILSSIQTINTHIQSFDPENLFDMYTPLMVATKNTNYRLVQFLLNQLQININYTTDGDYSQSDIQKPKTVMDCIQNVQHSCLKHQIKYCLKRHGAVKFSTLKKKNQNNKQDKQPSTYQSSTPSSKIVSSESSFIRKSFSSSSPSPMSRHLPLKRLLDPPPDQQSSQQQHPQSSQNQSKDPEPQGSQNLYKTSLLKILQLLQDRFPESQNYTKPQQQQQLQKPGYFLPTKNYVFNVIDFISDSDSDFNDDL